MKVSVCITTFNEEKTITKLLNSLLQQTKVPDEIVIVDGGSTDLTVSKISNFQILNHKQIKNIKFKIIKLKKASIARGRNIAIENAKYSTIAMTDAGCVCDKHWLERICTNTDITAGFYLMTGNSNFQKSLKPFLGITPKKFNDKTFLPSTRSISFKKSAWEKVGGFNEKFDRAGEDTEFNIQLSIHNFQITRVKNAIVFWEVPGNLKGACKKFFYYARGDAQFQKLSKHNLKVITIFGRYIIFLIFWPLFFVYLIYAYWKAGPWGTIIQVASDFAIIAGFIDGLL